MASRTELTLHRRAAAVAAALLAVDQELATDVNLAAAQYVLGVRQRFPPPDGPPPTIRGRLERLQALCDALWPHDALWPTPAPSNDENLPEEVPAVTRPGERTREGGRQWMEALFEVSCG